MIPAEDYPQASQTPLLASVVILNYNGRDLIDACIRSVLASDYPHYEIILVDNASTDGSLALAEAYGDRLVLVRNRRNYLSSRGLNRGIAAAKGDVIVLLDLDAEVRPDWLRKLLEPFATDPRVAVTGSKLLFGDGVTIQHAGGKLRWNGFTAHRGHGERDRGQWDTRVDVDFVTGASIAIRRQFLDELGGRLDELFPFYYEEVDLCWHAYRLGYRVLYAPESVAIHHESASMGRASLRYFFNFHRGRCRLLMKNYPWKDLLTQIPAAELRWFLQNAGHDRLWMAVIPAYMAAALSLPSVIARRLRRRGADRRRVMRQGAGTGPGQSTWNNPTQ